MDYRNKFLALGRALAGPALLRAIRRKLTPCAQPLRGVADKDQARNARG